MRANGFTAQLSRRLHVPAYLDADAREARGPSGPGQRTAPGQLQRRVSPPVKVPRRNASEQLSDFRKRRCNRCSTAL